MMTSRRLLRPALAALVAAVLLPAALRGDAIAPDSPFIGKWTGNGILSLKADGSGNYNGGNIAALVRWKVKAGKAEIDLNFTDARVPNAIFPALGELSADGKTMLFSGRDPWGGSAVTLYREP